jgi:predicted protein tyrosine phosphatase
MSDQKTKRYLFVCYANQQRSRTAEDVCRKMAKQRGLDIAVDSAGIAPGANNPLTKELINQADIIFVMQDYMQTAVEEEYAGKGKNIVCFDIPDIYYRNDPHLIRILQKHLQHYL